MAGASVPLEVVGEIMSFAGPSTSLKFIKHVYGSTYHWSFKVHPAFIELERKKTSFLALKRETWAHSNETTELVKALVRTWLSADNFELRLRAASSRST